MKVALPTWDKRLAPVLDFAHRLLMAKVKDGAVTRRWYHPMNPRSSSLSQAAALSQLGIDVLICGSLSIDLSVLIRSSSMRIIPGITGDVEEILQAFLHNTLCDPRFQMPGAVAGDSKLQEDTLGTDGWVRFSR
jgi:predicted Fe-Mo cluster-binding NifX family protein